MRDTSFVSGRVTAIVASYNHQEFLKERMDSLIAQSYKDLEILVIDDNSPDNSRDVLLEYKDNPRVRLYFESVNKGWVATSNLGAERATGEYIIFANCDDFCDNDQISVLVETFNKNNGIGLAFSSSKMVDEKSTVKGDDFICRDADFKKSCIKDIRISQPKMRKFLLKSCVIPNLSAALIRKEIFTKVGGFSTSYKVVSDWDLFFKISEITDFYYVRRSLNYFRNHGTTIRSQAKVRNLMNEYYTLLYGWFWKTQNSFIDHIQFRFQIAKITVSEVNRSNYLSLLPLWKLNCNYDKLIVPFHIVILLVRIFKKGINVFRKVYVR